MADNAPEKRATDDLHIESNPAATNNLVNASLDDKALNIGAIAGTEAEHSYGFISGFKTFKRAAFWSMAISTTIIMEGYDVTLIGNFYGYPAFRERYGEWLDDERGYQISGSWQQRFNILSAVANIVGALLNGWATAKYGHRKVLIVSLFWLTCFIFINFFATNIEMQLAGQTLCNVPWGVFATTPPAYAAEITPLAIRPYLTAYINLCWAIGQLLSQGILAGLVDTPGQWSYRIPFALQWIWPVPLAIAAYFAPESPWYCVRAGKLDEARKNLVRLSEPSHNVDYDATIAMMVHTDKVEKEEQAGVNLWDCFRGTNLRRTEIACMAFLSQITNGGALCYSATFFYQQVGIPARTAYYAGVGGQCAAVVGTCLSWLYIHKFGRRSIWLVGFGSLVLILWTIGFLAVAPNQTGPVQWAQAMLCPVWLAAYSMTVGPIVYTIVAEIGSSRLRTQTVVLARSTYYVGNIIGGGTLQPLMITPTDWDLRGKTAFFWAGTSTLTFVWGFFRLFETKGRTFGEMDYMFQKGISARHSEKYVIDEADQFALGSETDQASHPVDVKS